MTDDRMDRIIGKLLRAGVVLAAAVVAIGGVWYLAGSGEALPDYRQFHPEVRSIRAVAALPLPQAIILIGLLILIATPVARVIFSLVAFAMERDRTYVAITLTVLVILLYSLGTSWL